MKHLLAVVLLTSSLPAQSLPSPETFFGHPIGADRQLLDWNQVVAYFQTIGRSSDKLRVLEIGKSAEGRPLIAAFLGSAPTLRHLDRYSEIQSKLADPRKITTAEAARLIPEGKAVVVVTCSIHATEVASTHSAIEFAYRLVTGQTPRTKEILDHVLLILVPSLNPDGLEIVTRWYRKTLGTPFEGTSPPELYHKYAGHDNNRDWYIFSQPETCAVVSQLLNVWHPQIVLDMHQQGEYAARMFVPPWMDPIDPNIDPLIVQQTNVFGTAIATDLTAAGKTGIVVNALYDFWSPSRDYAAYHNAMRMLSETASAKIATPITVAPERIQSRAPGYNPRERTWNYLEPWRGGRWSLRDIIDYQLIAMESCLYQAALRREDLLRNFVSVGQRAAARQRPYAFVLPRDQIDPGAARRLAETLRFGMVDIERATESFQAGEKRYDEGAYVIRMQQPYSAFAKTLLERQSYPDLREYPGGPPRRPYDVTAQTLPLLMGVTADTIETNFTARLDPAVSYSFRLAGSPPESGGLPARDLDSWIAINKIWTADEHVWRDQSSGDFYTSPGNNRIPIARPRVALYRSFVPAMDEGWTRWLLDNFGFSYKSIGNADITALQRKFDVIVFPDQPPTSISDGYRPGSMPAEYTGGLGSEGVESLQKFARDGGTLVFFNRSAEYAVDAFGLKMTLSTPSSSTAEFFVPGSILNATVDTASSLSHGLPRQTSIWSEESRASHAVDSGYRIIARYPSSQVLASGYLLGEKYLTGRAALVDVPLGRGRVILFGMRPQYRAQSFQTFKLFFNSLLLASEKEN